MNYNIIVALLLGITYRLLLAKINFFFIVHVLVDHERHFTVC